MMLPMEETSTPSPEERLADLVRRRRDELSMPLRSMSEAAGVSINTWRRLEAGETIRSSSYAKIERALSWASGSVMAILGGAANPIVVEGGPAGRGFVLATIPDEELKGAVTNAIVAVSDTLTAREIREISDRVLKELRQRGMLDADRPRNHK